MLEAVFSGLLEHFKMCFSM